MATSHRPDAVTGLPRRDGLARSWALFRLFLSEQTDPVGFYRAVAQDAAGLVERHEPLRGRTVVDFGGGSGFYSEQFARAGARALVVDADLAEIRAHSRHPSAVVGDAERPPVADGGADIVFSSNLLEHVADFDRTADAMARVARPGGLVVLSYTVWLGPWGGHETSPWHYLGGHRARRRYERVHGRPPKNVYGESMFPASAADGMRWARSRASWLTLLEARPRYLPRWSAPLVRVPGVREVLTWNLWLVLRRAGDPPV